MISFDASFLQDDCFDFVFFIFFEFCVFLLLIISFLIYKTK